MPRLGWKLRGSQTPLFIEPTVIWFPALDIFPSMGTLPVSPLISHYGVVRNFEGYQIFVLKKRYQKSTVLLAKFSSLLTKCSTIPGAQNPKYSKYNHLLHTPTTSPTTKSNPPTAYPLVPWLRHLLVLLNDPHPPRHPGRSPGKHLHFMFQPNTTALCCF